MVNRAAGVVGHDIEVVCLAQAGHLHTQPNKTLDLSSIAQSSSMWRRYKGQRADLHGLGEATDVRNVEPRVLKDPTLDVGEELPLRREPAAGAGRAQ